MILTTGGSKQWAKYAAVVSGLNMLLLPLYLLRFWTISCKAAPLKSRMKDEDLNNVPMLNLQIRSLVNYSFKF